MICVWATQNCHKVCPEVFDFDQDQLQSKVRVDIVPAHLEDKVRKAARNVRREPLLLSSDLSCSPERLG